MVVQSSQVFGLIAEISVNSLRFSVYERWDVPGFLAEISCPLLLREIVLWSVAAGPPFLLPAGFFDPVKSIFL